jgi:hypothetical protein
MVSGKPLSDPNRKRLPFPDPGKKAITNLKYKLKND